MAKIFSKARVANFVAGGTIFFTLYAIVFQSVGAETLPVLTALSGFSAKHLWDSTNKED
jgi:hypothetical protein